MKSKTPDCKSCREKQYAAIAASIILTVFADRLLLFLVF